MMKQKSKQKERIMCAYHSESKAGKKLQPTHCHGKKCNGIFSSMKDLMECKDAAPLVLKHLHPDRPIQFPATFRVPRDDGLSKIKKFVQRYDGKGNLLFKGEGE